MDLFNQRILEEFELEKTYKSKVLASSLLVQHLPSWEKDDFYSSEIGEESSESEDERILSPKVIPRHLGLRMKKERFSDSQIIEESESEDDEQLLPPTKVVIRHLPPGMGKDEFFHLVSPLPAHDYKYFAEPDKALINVYSTAYINFVNSEDAFLFQKQFNGHIFQSSKGEKYKAIVDFAPSQQVPKGLPSRDSLCGTIDEDPDYLEFLESQKIQTTDMTEEIEVKKAVSKPSDPLVDFVNMQRAERMANETFYQPWKHNRRRQPRARQWKNCRSTDKKYPDFQPQHFFKNTRASGYN